MLGAAARYVLLLLPVAFLGYFAYRQYNDGGSSSDPESFNVGGYKAKEITSENLEPSVKEAPEKEINELPSKAPNVGDIPSKSPGKRWLDGVRASKKAKGSQIVPAVEQPKPVKGVENIKMGNVEPAGLSSNSGKELGVDLLGAKMSNGKKPKVNDLLG